MLNKNRNIEDKYTATETTDEFFLYYSFTFLILIFTHLERQLEYCVFPNTCLKQPKLKVACTANCAASKTLDHERVKECIYLIKSH